MECIWEDVEPKVPMRKTRADVMSPQEAVRARKSSKLHKLKPRSNKRDATKSSDAKKAAKLQRGVSRSEI